MPYAQSEDTCIHVHACSACVQRARQGGGPTHVPPSLPPTCAAMGSSLRGSAGGKPSARAWKAPSVCSSPSAITTQPSADKDGMHACGCGMLAHAHAYLDCLPQITWSHLDQTSSHVKVSTKLAKPASRQETAPSKLHIHGCTTKPHMHTPEPSPALTCVEACCCDCPAHIYGHTASCILQHQPTTLTRTQCTQHVASDPRHTTQGRDVTQLQPRNERGRQGVLAPKRKDDDTQLCWCF